MLRKAHNRAVGETGSATVPVPPTVIPETTHVRPQQDSPDHSSLTAEQLTSLSANSGYLTLVSYLSQSRAVLPENLTLRDAGRLAASRCRQRGLQVKKLPDPHFAFVLCYPVAVLEALFPPRS